MIFAAAIIAVLLTVMSARRLTGFAASTSTRPFGYFSKCWRATPISYAAATALATALPLLISWVLMGSAGRDQATIQEVWAEAAVNSAGLIGLLALATGVALGASSIGNELATGTAPFLFTRARSRGYFHWVAWGVAALQMAIFGTLPILAMVAMLAARSGSVVSWLPLWLIPVTFVSGMLAFGISSLLTVATRNSRQGLGAALVICFAYLISAASLVRVNVHLPSPAWLYTQPWTTASTTTAHGWPFVGHFVPAPAPLPAWSLGGWLLFAVVLALVQQVVIQRAEV
jgi:hypothetical protein